MLSVEMLAVQSVDWLVEQMDVMLAVMLALMMVVRSAATLVER